MDRRAFLRGSAALAALSVSSRCRARTETPLTLRFAHFAAEDQPAHIAAKQFTSRVEARTEGAIMLAYAVCDLIARE